MILAVLRYYGASVPDRRGRFALRCPFHDDHVSSGYVDVTRGTYKCYACGITGTADSLIEQKESTPDAAKRVRESLASKGDQQVRRQPDRAGTFVPYRARDQRSDGKGGKPGRRYFPFSARP